MPKRTEHNLVIRIGKSEAKVTKNITDRQTQWRGLSATAELLVCFSDAEC